MNLPADSASSRRTAYVLLIVVAVAGVAGRVVGVGRVYEPWLTRPADAPDDPRGPWRATRPEPMPTHSDNDRSRWATVRALAHDGTYVIGRRDGVGADGKPIDRGIVTEDGWGTIDKVLNPDTQDFYSSKPPLLPTLVAGEYRLLRDVFGWDITDPKYRWVVVPVVLLTFNVFPWAVSLWLLARVAERHGSTDWGRLYVVTAACFGTFLTTFAATLNNHNVAAWSAMFALYPALRVWSEEEAPAWLFAVAGFFAAFTAANELPATAFAAALFVLLLWRSPARTLTLFVPAALIPAAAFFGTNYAALGEWLPAYEKFGGPWYDYVGSYWRRLQENPTGIDAAGVKESRAVYAFHLLLGHHGVFALTPIFLLALAGMVVGLRHLRGKASTQRGLALASLLALAVTAVVLGFYVFVLGDRSRNYGGWTSGPRWLFWLTPLWLVVLLPAADGLGRSRWGRALGYLLLAVSVLSVSYPQYSPWRHPWIYNLLEATGLVKY